MNENIDLTFDSEFLSDIDSSFAPDNHARHFMTSNIKILEGHTLLIPYIDGLESEIFLIDSYDTYEEDFCSSIDILGVINLDTVKGTAMEYSFMYLDLYCDCCGSDLNPINRSQYGGLCVLCDKSEEESNVLQ